MRANFAPSLAAALVHEGGFVNDPQDPGGATNRGVTQLVYDAWRLGEGLARRSVRLINDYEVGAIFRRQYWNACRCDDLPAGLDYCIFDFAVNSGVNRASRYLQRALGAVEDGQIGPATVARAGAQSVEYTINSVCDARLVFLRQLPTFGHFGGGWTARVGDVRAKAEGMAA